MTIDKLMYYVRYYCSEDEILSSGYFVPLFKTDIEELEREFILKTQERAIIKQFEGISNADIDKEFKIFVEGNHLIKSWYTFERKRPYEDAIGWCKANNIVI